jgi:NAD(P)-dependent dehydrogenase (short-subunit alcohol dehydrogenase family)
MVDNVAPVAGVALVTGAGAGIGRGCAHALASAGAHVVVTDINAETAESVHAEIAGAGGKSTPFHLDVTDETEWVAVVSEVAGKYGPISTLLNNAALKASLVPDDRAALDTNLQTFDRMIAINLRGPFLGIRTVLPGMLDRGAGSIINISSIVSMFAVSSLGMAYGCAKAGINALTKQTAVTYGPLGVRCNAIAPGVIIVDESAVAQQQFRESTAGMTARSGRPHDIGAAVCFLASDGAEYVNGQVLAVDGGLTSRQPGLASAALNAG